MSEVLGVQCVDYWVFSEWSIGCSVSGLLSVQ